MANWPATLPSPSVGNFTDAPVAAFIRTEMDSGTARQRRRFTAVPHKVSATWVFDESQMPTFKSFFETTINFGTDWFTGNIDTGTGNTSKTIRFVSPYQASFNGSHWTITASLEVV